MPLRTNMQINLKRLKCSQKSIQIYLRPKFKWIFEYIQGQSKIFFGTYALRDNILGEMEKKFKFQYLQIYFDDKATIRIFFIINNVTIWIELFIWGSKYLYIWVFEYLFLSLFPS